MNGCPGNSYQKFRSLHDAVVFIQAALLRGTLEVIPN